MLWGREEQPDTPLWEVPVPVGWGRGFSLGSQVPAARSSSSLGLPGSRLGILCLGWAGARGGCSCLFAALISVPYLCLFAHREFKHGRGHRGCGEGLTMFARLLPAA